MKSRKNFQLSTEKSSVASSGCLDKTRLDSTRLASLETTHTIYFHELLFSGKWRGIGRTRPRKGSKVGQGRTGQDREGNELGVGGVGWGAREGGRATKDCPLC